MRGRAWNRFRAEMEHAGEVVGGETSEEEGRMTPSSTTLRAGVEEGQDWKTGQACLCDRKATGQNTLIPASFPHLY